MNITATHINYFIIYHRKPWLFSNGIQMEHTSDIVAEGNLLHEAAYPQRAEKYTELGLGANFENINLLGKIDFYDANKKVIHEIKRSNKIEKAHEWQVKFYIWLLALNGIEDVTATIEYPKMRERKEITFTEADKVYLEEIIIKFMSIINNPICPPTINAKICKSCCYYKLCYIEGLKD